jgi:hypothetical protein
VSHERSKIPILKFKFILYMRYGDNGQNESWSHGLKLNSETDSLICTLCKTSTRKIMYLIIFYLSLEISFAGLNFQLGLKNFPEKSRQCTVWCSCQALESILSVPHCTVPSMWVQKESAMPRALLKSLNRVIFFLAVHKLYNAWE